MSKYTTEVRFLCETLAGLSASEGGLKVDAIVSAAAPKIFEPFPIFDESYRLALEKKILRHFYTREIGFETAGLWALQLNNRMNEIMPYYNQLYKSQLLQFNPLYDVDYSRTFNRKSKDHHDTQDVSKIGEDTSGKSHSQTQGSTKDDSQSESSASGKSKTDTIVQSITSNNHTDSYSDTPQGSLNGVLTGAYLTTARVVNDKGGDDSTTTASGTTSNDSAIQTSSVVDTATMTDADESTNLSRNQTDTGTVDIDRLEDYIEHVAGKQGGGSYSDYLLKFRETFLNIDLQILEELNDLFMTIY